MTFDLAALQALPSSTETVGTVTYTGVRLWAVLNRAAAAPPATGARLPLYVLATGSDGYQALLSWGEIDPEFGNRQVLVAYSADGRDLSNGEGLRLIVPGDIKRGRSVRSLTVLGVFTAPAR